MYKVRKAGVIVLAVIILAAVALGVGAYDIRKHTVQTVYVEGNVHYTEEEIKAFVIDDSFLGNNSRYLSFKYKNKEIENIPFIDVLTVEIVSADTIKITVMEKAIIGYVKYLGTYMYFDKSGCVVESSGIRTMGVPQVTGLKFDRVVVGEELPIENKEIFGEIQNLKNFFDKNDLSADRLYFDSRDEITVYFGGVKVTLGDKPDMLEPKINALKGILPNLEGKSGTLHMEKYNLEGTYSFKPE